MLLKRIDDQLLQGHEVASSVDSFICELFSLWLPIYFFHEQAEKLTDMSGVCRHNIKQLSHRVVNMFRLQGIREVVSTRLLEKDEVVESILGFVRGGSIKNMEKYDHLPQSFKDK